MYFYLCFSVYFLILTWEGHRKNKDTDKPKSSSCQMLIPMENIYCSIHCSLLGFTIIWAQYSQDMPLCHLPSHPLLSKIKVLPNHLVVLTFCICMNLKLCSEPPCADYNLSPCSLGCSEMLITGTEWVGKLDISLFSDILVEEGTWHHLCPLSNLSFSYKCLICHRFSWLWLLN